MKLDPTEHLLLCPACNGAMELGEFRPGDKIAKCSYCGKLIDLPDYPVNEIIKEHEEFEENGRYKKHVKHYIYFL